jgi:hypothetical protein
MRPAMELADIFRRHGDAFRAAQGSRLLPDQRRVMAAIEACRTATLGGMSSGGTTAAWSNSCCNRHCRKCQGLARAEWLADRQADGPIPRPTIVELIAFVFAVFTLYGCVAELVLYGLVLLILGIPVFIWQRRRTTLIPNVRDYALSSPGGWFTVPPRPISSCCREARSGYHPS